MEKNISDKLKAVNEFLIKNLWMDFEVCKMNGGEVVLSGKIDELDDELVEIKFIQPFYISIPLSFSYEKGEFISLINGDEFITINKRYQVERGNIQFRITPDEGIKHMIIAKDIDITLRK